MPKRKKKKVGRPAKADKPRRGRPPGSKNKKKAAKTVKARRAPAVAKPLLRNSGKRKTKKPRAKVSPAAAATAEALASIKGQYGVVDNQARMLKFNELGEAVFALDVTTKDVCRYSSVEAAEAALFGPGDVRPEGVEVTPLNTVFAPTHRITSEIVGERKPKLAFTHRVELTRLNGMAEPVTYKQAVRAMLTDLVTERKAREKLTKTFTQEWDGTVKALEAEISNIERDIAKVNRANAGTLADLEDSVEQAERNIVRFEQEFK